MHLEIFTLYPLVFAPIITKGSIAYTGNEQITKVHAIMLGTSYISYSNKNSQVWIWVEVYSGETWKNNGRKHAAVRDVDSHNWHVWALVVQYFQYISSNLLNGFI